MFSSRNAPESKDTGELKLTESEVIIERWLEFAKATLPLTTAEVNDGPMEKLQSLGKPGGTDSQFAEVFPIAERSWLGTPLYTAPAGLYRAAEPEGLMKVVPRVSPAGRALVDVPMATP